MAENTDPARPPAGDPGQPPAGNPPSAPQGGATPPPSEPPAGQEPKVFDEAYVKQLRQEAASYRTKATAAETELQKIKDAQLSETDRAKKEATDAAAKAQRLEAELKAVGARAEVAMQSAGLKIVDADAAYRLIDQAAIQFDDQGKPTNIKALLDQLVKDKPFLIGQAGQNTNPNNPGRQGTALTMEQINKMTPEQVAANYEQVTAAMRALQA